MRTFIALFLPDAVLQAISETVRSQREALPDVRWTAIGNVHLTLRFLGDVESRRLDGLSDALGTAAAGIGPIRLRLGQAGAFPDMRAPRVVWVGLDGEVSTVRALADRLETELRRGGYGRADKPFAPHLTIGRLRPPVPRRDWTALLAGLRFPPADFTLAAAAVVKSELSPRGSRYTPLSTVPLRGGSEPASELS